MDSRAKKSKSMYITKIGCVFIIILVIYLVLTATSLTTTPMPRSSFRFVAWADSRGDSGSTVDSVILSGLAGRVNGLSPAPVFTIFPGDLCDSFSVACVGTDWKNALGASLFDKTFAVRGNHENGASVADWQSIFNPGSTVTRIGASAYSSSSLDFSFDYRNSHFVVIDLPGGGVNTMSSSQITWLNKDLTNAETRLGTNLKHEFLFWHGPLYGVTSEHGSEIPSSALVTVLNSHPFISAGFFGHEHVTIYAHLDSTKGRTTGLTCPIEEFTMGRAGAPPYSVVKSVDFSANSDGFAAVDFSDSDYNYTITIYNSVGTSVKSYSFSETGASGCTWRTGNITGSVKKI
jgi:hypothetical protein